MQPSISTATSELELTFPWQEAGGGGRRNCTVWKFGPQVPPRHYGTSAHIPIKPQRPT